MTTLPGYVAALRQAEAVPRPDGEDWKAMIDRMRVPGRIAEIDAATFRYFLEVLPPKYQCGNLFAFAEGAEPLLLFWRRGREHFCRQLTWDETVAFCRLACISLPS